MASTAINNNNDNNNRSTELTAEWTVHAQLTISRPNATTTANESIQLTNNRKFVDNDPTKLENFSNPVKVIYKWSTDDDKKPDESAEKSKVYNF